MNKIELQFCAYCCKTMRNCKINYLKRQRTEQELLPISAAVSDGYFTFTVRVGWETFVFTDETLVKSLGEIDETKRKILLYYYCADASDLYISKMLRLPRSTVNYQRRTALQQIRKIYERLEK